MSLTVSCFGTDYLTHVIHQKLQVYPTVWKVYMYFKFVEGVPSEPPCPSVTEVRRVVRKRFTETGEVQTYSSESQTAKDQCLLVEMGV